MRVGLAVLALDLLASSVSASAAESAGVCYDFKALAAKTYGFSPVTMAPGPERDNQLVHVDELWKEVEAHKAWLPCLRAAVQDPASDSFFRFNGSCLLRKLDDSAESKRISPPRGLPHRRFPVRGSPGLGARAGRARRAGDGHVRRCHALAEPEGPPDLHAVPGSHSGDLGGRGVDRGGEHRRALRHPGPGGGCHQLSRQTGPRAGAESAHQPVHA